MFPKVEDKARAKILICTMQYGYGYKQGTEKYVSNLTSGLKSNGYEVIIAAGDPENIKQENSKSKNNSQDRQVTLPSNGWPELHGEDVDYYVALLQEIRPDIVHMANPAHIGINLLTAAKQLNIPYFVTATDFWWLCPKHTLTLKDGSFCQGFENSSACRHCILSTHPRKQLQRLYRQQTIRPLIKGAIKLNAIARNQPLPDWPGRNQILKTALDQAEKVICLSKSGKKRIDNFFGLKNTHYLPTGLSESWFSKPKDHDFNLSQIKIGYLGAIAPHKGLHTLLDALDDPELKEVQLKIAGKTNDSQYANQLLSRELNIDYKGEIGESEAVSFIDSVDLIVIPSNSPENQPQVLLEASARKKPVVASDSPGCAELLDETVVFPANNAASLRSILKNFLQNPSSFPLPEKPRSALDITKETINLYKKATSRHITPTEIT